MQRSLILNFGSYTLYGVNVNADTLTVSLIIGVSAINIFLMALVFNSLLYGIIEESKKS